MSESSPNDADGQDAEAGSTVKADEPTKADKADEAERHLLVRPAIYLDYGADGAAGEDAACEVCARGMRFRSRWQFDLSAVLHIAFAFHDEEADRFEAEGIVVECNRDGDGRYLTTLAFVEVPKDLRAALGKVSARLVFPETR